MELEDFASFSKRFATNPVVALFLKGDLSETGIELTFDTGNQTDNEDVAVVNKPSIRICANITVCNKEEFKKIDTTETQKNDVTVHGESEKSHTLENGAE